MYPGSPSQYHQTMVTGQPPPNYNPVGFAPPGLAGQLIGGAVGGMFGKDYTYIGQSGLNHHRNLQSMLFYQSHYRMIQQTSKRDVHMIQDTLRAFGVASGINVNNPQWHKESAQDAENLGMLVGMGLISPQQMDLLSGGRSATALAHGIGMAGRHRMDPVTGGWGLSEKSAGMLASGLHAYYYDIGGRFGPKDRAEMNRRTRGLTSGEMGGLFDELTRRGLMDTGGSFRDRMTDALRFMDADTSESGGRNRLRSIMRKEGMGDDISSLSDKDLHKLFEYGDVRQGMRSADVVRVKQKLDDYTGAIKAVQEIFGEQGKFDAPMAELFNQLQQFTMGSSQMLKPGQSEQMVREMHAISRRAGIGMDSMDMLLSSAGQQAQSMGLESVFASQAVMSTMAFRQAYGDTNMGNTPAWGMVSADKLAMMHSQARMNAQGSQFTNRLGALARLEARGATLSDSAKDLLRAARVGDMSTLERMSGMSSSEFLAAMAGGDVSARDLQTALTHREANDEFAFYEEFGDVAVEMMPRELANRVLGGDTGAFTSAARNKLTSMIGKNDGKLARAMADSAARELVLNMDVDTRHDADRRNAGMASAMRRTLEEAAANGDASAAAMLARGDLDKQLALFAEEMYAHADTATGQGALVNLIDMNDPTLLARKRGTQQLGRVEGVISRMFSERTGSTSILQRIFGAINTAGAEGKGVDLKTIVAEGMGLTETSGLSEGLLEGIRKIEDIRGRAVSLIEESTGKSIDELSAKDIEETLTKMPELMQALSQVESELENMIREDENVRDAVQKTIEEEKAAAEEANAGEVASSSGGGVTVDRLALQATQIIFNGKVVMENADGEADVAAQDSPKGPANTAVA